MDILYNRACKEEEKLRNTIEEIRDEINTLPEGKLVITRNQNRYKWYWSKNGKSTYLPKKKEELARKLARKTYLENLMQETQQEEKALKYYLKHHRSGKPKSEKMLEKGSRFRKLLDMEPEWVTEEYEKNTKYPEHLIHKSISGHLLRSKSEAMIDRALYLAKIPFHYEERLELNGVVLYPDFKITDPNTGTIKYWEHFGMMDKPEYARLAINKLELYLRNGMIPQRDLILTWETKDKPLDYELVEAIIQYYFL